MCCIAQIAQSFVADVVPVDMRPKFIGRLQACIGAGFVVGPLVMVVLNKVFKMPTKVRIIKFLYYFFKHSNKFLYSIRTHVVSRGYCVLQYIAFY